MNEAFRSMRLLIILLLILVGGWFALPSIASELLEWWLEHQGYEQVEIRVGRSELHPPQYNPSHGTHNGRGPSDAYGDL